MTAKRKIARADIIPMERYGRERKARRAKLVATIMFEIDDEKRRHAFLRRLGGVEETDFIQFGEETVEGRPEEDVERTSAAGKASSVQLIHFPFTPARAAVFMESGRQVIVGFRHENYSHMAVMPEAVRACLAGDLE